MCKMTEPTALTGKAVSGRWGDRIAAKIKEQAAKVAARREPIDPDNPPLTGNEIMVPARELFLKKHAEMTARIKARQKAYAVWEDDGGSVTDD